MEKNKPRSEGSERTIEELEKMLSIINQEFILMGEKIIPQKLEMLIEKRDALLAELGKKRKGNK